MPLASLLGERVAESREGLDSNVGDLVRLCVHASSLRGIGGIAELSMRNDCRQLVCRAARPLARGRCAAEARRRLRRRHHVHLEPLDADVDAPRADEAWTPM